MRVKDDLKLIAQCQCENISHVLTEDSNTLTRYVDRLAADERLEGPLIVGPSRFIASGAYLRGGNWIAERCTIGPGVELKSSFVFAGSMLDQEVG